MFMIKKMRFRQAQPDMKYIFEMAFRERSNRIRTYNIPVDLSFLANDKNV